MRFSNQRDADQQLGQGLVEYALIILLVSVAVVGMLTAFGGSLSGAFAFISASWPK